MNLRQLPNVITGARMALVVPLVWSLHDGRYPLALGLALVAGASDAIDGWIEDGNFEMMGGYIASKTWFA